MSPDETQSDRSPPITFLVSTPGGGAAETWLGTIAPALDRLGSWRRVPHPESSLPQLASRVEAEGGRAIHLAIGTVHECYLTPAVPSILWPIWDYPDVPDADLCDNGRLNFARVAGHADAILAASTVVADAFRRIGVATPILPLPIPARPGLDRLPTWGKGLLVSADVPHFEWPGRVDEPLAIRSTHARVHASPAIAPAPSSLHGRLALAGRKRLRRVKPYLSNASVERLDGFAKGFAPIVPILRRPNPIRIAGGMIRLGYRHLVRRWIGEAAHNKLRRFGRHGRFGGNDLPGHPPQVLGKSHLALSGLVFSTTVDFADRAGGEHDAISAFLHAFRDRADATLVIRLSCPADREEHDLNQLDGMIRGPRLGQRCRVVAVTDRLSFDGKTALLQATSFYVEARRSSGGSASLVEALAAGRPAIAPGHSGYADWVDAEVGIAVESHREPTSWPIDPLGRTSTEWHRTVWSSLKDAFIEAAAIADAEPSQYERLSSNARSRMAGRASVAEAAEILETTIERIPSRPLGAFAWA